MSKVHDGEPGVADGETGGRAPKREGLALRVAQAGVRRRNGAAHLTLDGKQYDIAPMLDALKRQGVLEPITAICRTYYVLIEDVLLGVRTFTVKKARDACAAFLRKQGFTHPEIGKVLGWADHSSSIHACRRHEAREKEKAGG